MDKKQESTGTDSYRRQYGDRERPSQGMSPQDSYMPQTRPASPLVVGAKTVAGIGIGLVAVMSGAAILGLAAETILVPSLLMKLAGGIAGGGVGMAKGLKGNKAPSR